RLRASRGAMYNLRPQLDETAGWSDRIPASPLEQRKGHGIEGPWETVTFNMQSFQSVYAPKTAKMNRMVLVIGHDPLNSPAPNTMIRLEIDWVAAHSGITPDTLAAKETLFGNNLDDDGDGLVDRDDDNYRVEHPVSVYFNYQTVYQNMYRAGFLGWRHAGSGQSGQPIYIDPEQFSPAIAGKRQIVSTFYPLDYVRHPNYELPPYNEFADQTTSGIWPGSCPNPYLPPTEQFRSLNLDYDSLGCVEEYDTENLSWVRAQVSLARRFGVHGFIYNDQGLDPSIGSEYSNLAMTSVLNSFAYDEWKDNPFHLASFYSTTLRDCPQDIINDLGYIINFRANTTASYIKTANKPVVFIYPSINPEYPVNRTADWPAIYDGLLDLGNNNYDGRLNAPNANIGTSNTLSLTFDRYQTDTYGRMVPGMMDTVEVFDKDMNPITQIDCGTTIARAYYYLEGWSTEDVPGGRYQTYDYTHMRQPAGSPKPGYASMILPLPASAAYLKLRMFGFGAASEVAGTQQNCELRINGDGGPAGLSFPTVYGWTYYLFHLRNLPATFDNSPSSLPSNELPLSMWGDIPERVRHIDEKPDREHMFDGEANYGSSCHDSRIEVSFPRLYAATIRPGFDDTGMRYYCSVAQPYFMPRKGGATYREEWERALTSNADMIIITSWNEFAEGTNIEPDIEHGFQYGHLTLTYSLITRGFMETGRWPSATNLTVKRFDMDGGTRGIEFTIHAADYVTFKNCGFGDNGAHIRSIKRNGSELWPGSPDVVIEAGKNNPALTLNNPDTDCVYQIEYFPPAQFQIVRDDRFTDSKGIAPSSELQGWSSFGFSNTLGWADYDSETGAYRANVAADSSHYRVAGFAANWAEWLLYTDIGPENFVRVKYYVYAGGQSDPQAGNQIPNFRLRAQSRFAVNSMLEVFNHTNDPSNQNLEQELRPSRDPGNPSIYRVDFDLIDVPAITDNAIYEGVQRGLEAYAIYPQDNGYIGLTESVIGTYPASALSNTVPPMKIYAPSATDAGDLRLMYDVDISKYNVLTSTTIGAFASIDTSAIEAELSSYLETTAGITLDTSNVPNNRVGVISREFVPGYTFPELVRVEEGKQYKISWHLTSTQQSNLQSQMRVRARSVKFGWSQKLEIGGAWAAGSFSNRIAQQSMPGIGCQNPDKYTTDTQGGWYNLLVHTPMSADIRPEFPLGSLLSLRMPYITAQPGPGINANSRRDLRVGCDLLDTLSGGANRDLEKGNFTLDRIEVRIYDLVPD
ncbi:MAG: glycoside hydrolase family 99-like domain-containing protein, partial [bacterium]